MPQGRKTVQISARAAQILELALVGYDSQQIAQRLGCARRTVQLCLQRHRAQLEELRRQRLERLSDELAAAGREAIRALRAALKDPLATPAVRVRAAEVTLQAALRLHQATSIEARIAELEEAIERWNG